MATDKKDTQAATAPKPTYEQLAAQVAALTGQKAKQDAQELAIAEKMRVGLPREQAIAVLKRQGDFDASPGGKLRAAVHAQRQAAAKSKS